MAELAQSLARACQLFRERRFAACIESCRREAGEEREPAVRVQYALLLCDSLQAAGDPDWREVERFARHATRAARAIGPSPLRLLRQAQAVNRIGVSRRAQCCTDYRQAGEAADPRPYVNRLDDLSRIHAESITRLEHLTREEMASLDPREVHATIVSSFNNRASALVEIAAILEREPGAEAERLRLLAEALDQFVESRSACDNLLPEARIATLNDEAEVLLRFGRLLDHTPSEYSAAMVRAHATVRDAIGLLDRLEDAGQRAGWEAILREKLDYSYTADLIRGSRVGKTLLADAVSDNRARKAELASIEHLSFQVATVDLFHMAWSPVRLAVRVSDLPQERFAVAVAALASAFSARQRLDSPLLRCGWNEVHLDYLTQALDAAVELGAHEAVCELIETSRAQGYSPESTRRRGIGDVIDSPPNRALAGIGLVTIGSPPDITVRGGSALNQEVEEAVDIEVLRGRVGGDGAWWWSLLSCNDTIYWAILRPDGSASGRLVQPGRALVPEPLRDEIARRVSAGDPPLRLIISPSAQLGGTIWATLPVGRSGLLVDGADIRLVPPAPLLGFCADRPPSLPPWQIKVLAAADPRGDLRLQMRLPELASPHLAAGATVLRSSETALTRASLLTALASARSIPGGGTFVFTGHGNPHASGGTDGSGLVLGLGDTLTAENIINWQRSNPADSIPARVLLAGCQTLDFGPGTHEWISIAPAALLAGAELVLATCADLVSDEATLHANARVCEILAVSDSPVADLNRAQRDLAGRPNPLLLYSAVVGGNVDSPAGHDGTAV